MSSDVVLTAALRSNLLSLQNTQRLIDDTQLRLATGLKVNSALDNPQNFFAAQSLNNRAGDLTRLLDGISQSIRTIEEANTGVTALTDLLNQADSIATSAREELSASGEALASVVGNVDLRDVTDLTDITGIDTTDRVAFFAEDADGDAITLGVAGVATEEISITTNYSIEQFITAINDITNTSDNSQVFEASLTDDGFLKITNLLGGDARIEFQVAGGTVNADLASGLGFSYLNLNESAGAVLETAPDRAGVTFSRTADLVSQNFYTDDGGDTVVARRSTLLSALEDSTGTALGFSGTVNDAVVLGVDGDTLEDLGNIADLTIQGFVDAINTNSNLQTKIRASFDETTGQISIEQLDSSITSVQIGARDDSNNAATAAAIDFGFGILSNSDHANSNGISAADNAAANAETENLIFGTASAVIAGLEEDYNKLLQQIDGIVEDAQYRGVNLLGGDDLETFFNEDRSNSLLTSGTDFTANGLGLSAANFRSETVAASAQTEIRTALLDVRAFGNSIANDLAIIQTRRDFTESTINTLEAGADDLTVADQNEEGANLLALQTRQTLGITSLSLASQSQQAVLRLF